LNRTIPRAGRAAVPAGADRAARGRACGAAHAPVGFTVGDRATTEIGSWLPSWHTELPHGAFRDEARTRSTRAAAGATHSASHDSAGTGGSAHAAACLAAVCRGPSACGSPTRLQSRPAATRRSQQESRQEGHDAGRHSAHGILQVVNQAAIFVPKPALRLRERFPRTVADIGAGRLRILSP
jgi:hypothetical protein